MLLHEKSIKKGEGLPRQALRPIGVEDSVGDEIERFFENGELEGHLIADRHCL